MITVVGGCGIGLSFRVSDLVSAGQTIIASSCTQISGGKSVNHAVGLAYLGFATELVSAIGADDLGQAVLATLATHRVGATHVHTTSHSPTMLGVLQIAESGENAIIVNPGALNEVDARLVTSAEATIRTSDCVVVSLEVPPAAAHHALLLGRQHGVRTVLNLSPVPERQVAQGLMSLADILVVNETEAIELTAGASDIEVAALQLASMAGRDVVITRGRHGAIVVDSGRVVAVPGIEVTVVDTSGAGDAFLCGLVASLSSGTDLAEAARVGCLAGALVVGGPGFVEALDRWDNCDDLAALRPITNS